MELGTFGAVMGFASQVAAQSEAFYTSACERTQCAEMLAILEGLREQARKDRASMEQMRRENVTEMILEPITGLHQEDFEVAVEAMASEERADTLQAALRLEERDVRFFTESATRLPLPEVSRVFRRIAKRKESNLARLRALAR
jgi:rubrerythrin